MALDIFGYSHLNNTDTDKVPFSIRDTAATLIKLNYGQQRLLAELVRQREAAENDKPSRSRSKHTQQLRELLESGWY